MKNFKHSAVLLVFALLAQGAVAALIPTVNVVEMEASEFNMPAHEADTMEVVSCEGCSPQKLQVSSNTVYRVGGFDARPIELAEMQRGFRKSENKDDLIIYVAYDVASGSVNEIVIGVIE